MTRILVERVMRTIAKTTFCRGLMVVVSLIASIMLIASPAMATSLYEIPMLSTNNTTWLIDKAEVISRANEGRLEKDLSGLSAQTGNDVRLVTIRRLDYGETVDSFATKLFERWFSTPEAQANQVVLVIDTVTNTVGIHTGDAVKDIMPDAIAQSVANETAIAPLRKGDKYNQALLDVSDRMVAVLSGEPDPGPPDMETDVMSESTFTSAEDTDTNNATVLVVGFLVAATIIPMATYYLYQILQS